MRNVLGNNQKQQQVLQRSAEAQKPSSIFSLQAFRMSGCVGGDVQGQPPLCDLVDALVQYQPGGLDSSVCYREQYKSSRPCITGNKLINLMEWDLPAGM